MEILTGRALFGENVWLLLRRLSESWWLEICLRKIPRNFIHSFVIDGFSMCLKVFGALHGALGGSALSCFGDFGKGAGRIEWMSKLL
jgi:hypothetical protein